MGSQISGESTSRRQMAYLSLSGTTQLHLRSPIVIAIWSVAFPGTGHILLSKYVRGFLLFIWEVVINYNSHINLLILYSFIGDFETAKKVVNIRWMLLYIPTYIFIIWDSYRTAVDMNHSYILAAREDAPIKPFKIGAVGVNHLDKRNPWVSAAWSALAPGSGQLYEHRILTALFVGVWWIVVCYTSNLLPSLHYTLLGDFEIAKSILDMQWFLNVPSIYLFSIYDAYVNTVENNKLFDWEQKKFLRTEYQSSNFIIPFKKNMRGDRMYIVSTFDHSIYLEMAVTEIQTKGIKKENILAVPVDKRNEERKLFDSIHSSDGLSLFDLSAILAVMFGIFGAIYGFVLKWGPLFCGLAGIFIGMVLGFAIKFIITKKYSGSKMNNRGTEVVLIIECIEGQMEMVKEILWKHNALGVGKLDMS